VDRPPLALASENRVHTVPWEALAGLAPALDAPLAEVLSGTAAERVLDRLLRRLGPLAAPAREAVAEAVFGVGLWRRRLRAQLALADPTPRQLLASLVRDLGGRADAPGIVSLDPAALPPPRPAPATLADRFSLPDWLAEELQRAAGEESAALADALDRPGPLCLRPNLLQTDTRSLAERLASEGVATSPGRLVPSCLVVHGRANVYGLAAQRDGLFEVQDEGSQLLGMLVEAAPGETVLDACAGAGGKALLLAAAVGRAGKVLAADPDAERLVRLRARAARAGADGIVEVIGAAPWGEGERRDREGRVLGPPGMVDRALVDAPCSELGALRRGPDLRWRMDPAAFGALPELQSRILAAAAGRLRPGGRLVYATCTFRAEENESVALAFEASHPGFRRVQPTPARGALTPDGFVRTWPHRHGTDGFFAAAWARVA
jgi:16S rRNA (cytosine967-C5)-methyltransferase